VALLRSITTTPGASDATTDAPSLQRRQRLQFTNQLEIVMTVKKRAKRKIDALSVKLKKLQLAYVKKRQALELAYLKKKWALLRSQVRIAAASATPEMRAKMKAVAERAEATFRRKHRLSK
jgi:hypothetical protein